MQEFEEQENLLEWLLSEAASPFLVSEGASSERSKGPEVRTARLTVPQRIVIDELFDLRRRAMQKFPFATEMFFTRRGLEQATDFWIAEHKTRRYSMFSSVADLCCGIGGDLIALAKQVPKVIGVDRDPIMARLAARNLLVVLAQHVEVRAVDVIPEMVREVDAWHLDPDRRPNETRTTQLDHFDPDLDTINRLLEMNINGGVKIAPAADVPVDWVSHSEREWISSRGECRQQVVWFGRLAGQPGRRKATRVTIDHQVTSFSGDERATVDRRDRPGRFVFDTDPALRASQLVNSLGIECGLDTLGDHGAYLTGDTPTTHSFLTAFEVLEATSLDIRRLKRMLREHRIGALELKQRGVKRDLVQLKKELTVPGENSATLILYREGPRELAILSRRSGA